MENRKLWHYLNCIKTKENVPVYWLDFGHKMCSFIAFVQFGFADITFIIFLLLHATFATAEPHNISACNPQRRKNCICRRRPRQRISRYFTTTSTTYEYRPSGQQKENNVKSVFAAAANSYRLYFCTTPFYSQVYIDLFTKWATHYTNALSNHVTQPLP